jgi:hypothetical protein
MLVVALSVMLLRLATAIRLRRRLALATTARAQRWLLYWPVCLMLPQRENLRSLGDQ